ncbi:MAG: hypothetical protein H7Y03_12845 [Chitinophagaceae bacterium]|nr:hypothetical protein [Chitinophagaceae bacterium]
MYYQLQKDEVLIELGAALALKSKVLLYAASELFNNPSWAGGYTNKELISLSGKTRTLRCATGALGDANRSVKTGTVVIP